MDRSGAIDVPPRGTPSNSGSANGRERPTDPRLRAIDG